MKQQVILTMNFILKLQKYIKYIESLEILYIHSVCKIYPHN